MSEATGNSVEYFYLFGRNFRADAVTTENCDPYVHLLALPLCHKKGLAQKQPAKFISGKACPPHLSSPGM